MMRITHIVIFIVLLLIPVGVVFGIERFPPPNFDSGYELPVTTVPEPRRDLYEYLDVAVLLAALSLSSYLALKKRSRRGVFILGIFALLYFGFWRQGCVCSIGAIQNITLALFDSNYTVPLTVIAFFLLPLIFTLFFGRAFCAAVCPLGAIQDVVALRPIKIPSWLGHALGLLVYIYLGAAVLFAATGSAFIICEYDPFVAFFRRSGSLNMLILGACFILIAVFVGRPYCRFLCPYSVLLNWVSRTSKWHVTITPDECIQCRLCEDSCPFDSIEKPTQETGTRNRSEGKKRLAILIALLPVFIILTGWIGTRLGTSLSRVDATVSLAERIWLEDTGKVEGTTDASDAFRGTGQSTEELYAEALDLKNKFVFGGTIFGGFIGLVIGMKLIFLSVRRRRTDYEINRGTCVSCGRCFDYCPIEYDRSKNS
jgi:polyferredoxin